MAVRAKVIKCNGYSGVGYSPKSIRARRERTENWVCDDNNPDDDTTIRTSISREASTRSGLEISEDEAHQERQRVMAAMQSAGYGEIDSDIDPLLLDALEYLHHHIVREDGKYREYYPDERQRWINVGLALHHDDDTEDMRDVWIEWSRTDLYHGSEHEWACITAWDGFEHPYSGGLTVASVYHWAQEAGWTRPKTSQRRRQQSTSDSAYTRPEIMTKTPQSEEGADDDATNIAMSRDGRRKIQARADEHITNDETLEVLTADPNLYRHGIDWVTVDEERAKIEPMGHSVMRHHISSQVYYYREKQHGKGKNKEWVEEHCTVPPHIVPYTQELPHVPRSRNVTGVARMPTLRADGSIIDQPGYDATSGIYYIPDGNDYPEIPANPTLEDANAALCEIEELVEDYPMAAEDRTAWIAAILTIIAREMIDCPTPLMLIAANRARTGKGKLAEMISIIATGSKASPMSLPRRKEEADKTITAVARESRQVAMIDNIHGSMDGYAALEIVLTSTLWTGRILGESKMWSGPWRTVLLCTANHPRIESDDMRGRILPIAIMDPASDPTKRKVRRKNLVGHVQQNRHKYHAAAITVLRAYVAAGMPEQDLEAWGSYEKWSPIIRGTLVWAGRPDPYLTRESWLRGETVEEPLDMLIKAWPQLYRMAGRPGGTSTGITSGDIARAIATDRHGGLGVMCPDMRDAIVAYRGDRGGEIGPHAIGHILRGAANQTRPGGLRLVESGDASCRTWQVEHVDRPGEAYIPRPRTIDRRLNTGHNAVNN